MPSRWQTPRALRLANLKSLRQLCKLEPLALPFARLPLGDPFPESPFPNPRLTCTVEGRGSTALQRRPKRNLAALYIFQ